MGKAIKDLLAQIDDHTLNLLPCFYYRPDVISFRIGLTEGPQIYFSKVNEENYDLYIKDEKGTSCTHPILRSSNEFTKCQSIYQRIRGFDNDTTYKKQLEENLAIMLANLINIIKPVF